MPNRIAAMLAPYRANRLAALLRPYRVAARPERTAEARRARLSPIFAAYRAQRTGSTSVPHGLSM